MKNKLGKIAMLGAAMLVTVPTATALSACGNKHSAESEWQTDADYHWHRCAADINDDHVYNLGEHTWKIYNDEYTCTVCDYSKTVKGASNQHVRTFQAALRDMAEYQGAVTMNCVMEGSGLGIVAGVDAVEMTSSYDPVKGIGYETGNFNNKKVVGKVFQDGNRYVEYAYEYHNNDGKITEKSNYALVDQTYVSQAFGNNDTGIGNNEIDERLLNTELDSTMFAVMYYEMQIEPTIKDDEIAVDDFQINYAVQDEVMTVTISLHGTFKNAELKDSDYTLKNVYTIKNGAVVSIKAQSKGVATVNFQRVVIADLKASQYCEFDQAGFDRIKTGEIPTNIKPKNQ